MRARPGTRRRRDRRGVERDDGETPPVADHASALEHELELVRHRLVAAFPDRSPTEVAGAVSAGHEHFEGARVQNFRAVLIERHARALLRSDESDERPPAPRARAS